MSSTWYTLKCIYSDAEQCTQTAAAFEDYDDENLKDIAKHFKALGAKKIFQDFEDMYLEYVECEETQLNLQFQGRASSELSQSFIRGLAKTGAEYIIAEIFHDQVGEGYTSYFKHGKAVDFEDIAHILVADNPDILIQNALEEEDEHTAIRLLSEGADPNTRISGVPLLLYAMEHEMPNLAIAVLKAGANIHAQYEEEEEEDEDWDDEDWGDNGYSILDSALELDHPDLVKLVLEKGGDAKVCTPLATLAHRPETHALEIARLLLEHGADINACSSKGSPLWAVAGKSFPLEQYLKQHGARLIAPKDTYDDSFEDNVVTAIIHHDMAKLNSFLADPKFQTIPNRVLITACVDGDRTDLLQQFQKPIAPFQALQEGDPDDVYVLIERAIKLNKPQVSKLLIACLPEQVTPPQQDTLAYLLSDVMALPDGLAYVKAFHQCGADLNYTEEGEGEETPLTSAISHNRPEIVNYLLEAGADPNLGSHYGELPLHCALENATNAAQILPMLLAHKANPNTADRESQTCLHMAAGNAKLASFIPMLLQAGADPTESDNDYITPLHDACRQGLISAVQALLPVSDIVAKDGDGDTPLDCAKMNGHEDIVHLITQYMCDLPPDQGIWLLAQTHQVEVFQKILAPLDSHALRDADGNNLLHIAASSNTHDIAHLLIALSFDVQAKNAAGNTPLGTAILNEHTKMVSILLKAGADPDGTVVTTPDEEDFEAVAQQFPGKRFEGLGFNDIVELDESMQGDLSIKGDSIPMISYAASRGKKKIVMSLLAAGADIQKTDEGGWQPIVYAIYSDSKKLIQQLLDNGANPNADEAEHGSATILQIAAYRGDADIVKLLCKRGANLEARDKRQGTTALSLACYADMLHKENVVRTLIKAGADVNTQDNTNRTPLMWAVKCLAYDACDELLDANADRTLKDNEGRSAMDYAKDVDEDFIELLE